ncbi:Gfo/Idh/MocA family protein [Armatimonas sp.]|uniref:Gfo/Idh/MocA family protein n=1 Tax=Armatimonas sp. TaxID=1872638 RepID=UPI0034D95655
MQDRRIWKVAGVSFDHMHMGDLLRQVSEHPNAELVGVADTSRERMAGVVASLAIPEERVFTDWRLCLETTQSDIVILCPKTGEHGQYVVDAAPYGTHILVEKPFAANLADADRMITAMAKTGKTMIINWPLAWYPPHVTTKRLLSEGLIGDVLEVHYYDGNRGPLRHIADKVEITEDEANRQKSESWWYQESAAGGSLQDYLGYGVTLGTWFLDGRKPVEVTCVTDSKPGLDVDEHSITICRYATPYGLSKFETRWGTFTDPWTLQPQPKCGFVVMGTHGTISSYDYEPVVRVQTKAQPETHEIPVDMLQPGWRNPIEHLLHHLETNCPLHGPLDPTLCRIGQQIVDSAMLSAKEKRTVTLLD